MTSAASTPAGTGLDQGAASSVSTPGLIAAMLDSGAGISDLILSPGRPPQVEKHGDLVPVPVAGIDFLRPDDTARLAKDLISGNEQALRSLKGRARATSPGRCPSAAASA